LLVVLRTVCALPDESVLTTPVLKVPDVVENVTVAPGSTLALTSKTVAVIVDDPPLAGTRDGFAESWTRPTAALPIRILSAPFALTDAPPDNAVMFAVPDCVPARNVTLARPVTSVEAVAG